MQRHVVENVKSGSNIFRVDDCVQFIDHDPIETAVINPATIGIGARRKRTERCAVSGVVDSAATVAGGEIQPPVVADSNGARAME